MTILDFVTKTEIELLAAAEYEDPFIFLKGKKREDKFREHLGSSLYRVQTWSADELDLYARTIENLIKGENERSPKILLPRARMRMFGQAADLKFARELGYDLVYKIEK